MLCITFTYTYGQSPGGVTGMTIEYWLKADEIGLIPLNDGQDVTSWEDKSGNNRHFHSPNIYHPRYAKDAMNYHSAVQFYRFVADGVTNTQNRTRKLVTSTNFTPSENKSYFTILVSAMDLNDADAAEMSVFSLNRSSATTDAGNTSFGWTNTGFPWMDIAASPRTSNAIERKYGIGIYSLPNTTSTSFRPQIYINGLVNGANLTSSAINTGSFPSVIGNSNTGTNGDGALKYFYGNVMEIIVLSKPANSQTLTSTEINRINSYLAIKYGITLNSAQPTYTLSNGNIAYDTSNAAYSSYNKNIIGIARDDASGLLQKQSKSYDGDGPTIYLGELATTNYENTDTSLDNLQSLMIGSNGLNGLTTYTQTSGTIFSNYTLAPNESINNRSQTIYKAKLNGMASKDINMEINGWDWVIVSNSTAFTPASTRIYKVVNGNVDNITINDGDFISFAKLHRAPVNISGVEVEYWLTADNVSQSTINDGQDVHRWMDISGKGRNFGNTASDPFFPRYIKSSMNFHSSVEFYTFHPDEGGPTLVDNYKRRLISENTFSPATDRSYYVIWISKVDPQYSSTYASVFTLNPTTNTSADGNIYGWNTATANNPKLYHETASTEYVHDSSTERGYGIGIAVLPNNTTVAQQQYLNALSKGTATAARALSTQNFNSVIGTSSINNGTYYNWFSGEVMEIVVLSKSGTGNTLTADELKRINSHYALKYGITLNPAQVEYVLSNGTSVYNASGAYASYNKDVIGIFRDDEATIYQKQSVSSDNPTLTVYTGELAEINAENNSDPFNNHEALVLGANGSTGSSSYVYNEDTEFLNYTLQTYTDPVTGRITTERLSSIFNYKFKAKTTGNSSYTVNLKPSLGEYVLISADENFLPSNTRIYRIEEGTVENVVINDGEYIGFAYYLKAPGGVTNGLKMWLNASIKETLTFNANDEIINWVDYAGFGTTYFQRTATGSGAGAPLYLECDERTNFHPTPLFRKWQDALITNKAPFSVASPQNTAIYAVVNHNLQSSDRTYFLGFGATTVQTNARRPAFGVFRGTGANINRGFGRIGSTGLTNSSAYLFNSGATTIAGYHWNRGVNITFEFDGYPQTVTHTYNASVMNGPGMLGLGSSSNSYFLNGIMPEVIAYEGVLTQNERNKINSYLGLKYALTIDLDKTSTTTNFNFTLSDDTSIWDGNDVTHRNYHHNVASLVRDDNADLENMQAKSTDVGAIIHMGVGSKLGCDPDLSPITTDRTALTWGHNNTEISTYTFTPSDDFCGDIDSKLNGRIWLVDNTNFTQEVILRAGGDTFPYNGANYQVYLLVADSPTKFATNTWDQVIPMTYVDGQHQVNYKFTEKYTYFSFGGKVVAACEGCDFQGYKTLDFARVNWPTNGDKGPRNFNLGDNFNVRVSVLDPNTALRTNYPRSSTLKSLRHYRRSNANTVTTKIEFLDNSNQTISSAAVFEIFDIDRVGTSLDDVQIIGLCNGSPSYPKKYYTYTRGERSTYTINQSIGKSVAKLRGVPYNGNVGYTNKRGRVLVEFEFPVQEIQIIYKTTTSGSSNYIGIGPFEFYCPVPPPPPNEDGLIFTKQATPEVLLCEQVSYTFRITNTNCDDKPFTFTDTLPEGMTWVEDSFVANDFDMEDVTVTGYGTRTLTVSGLSVAGGQNPFLLRANAIFDLDAAPGTYSNQATISYDQLGVNVDLNSTDRLTGNALTETLANLSDRPLPLVTTFSTNKSCFNLNGEIEVTLNIENPNAQTIEDVIAILEFESDIFSLVPGSISSSSGLSLPANSADPEAVELDGFNIPNGTHWIRYKVLASDNMANYEIDPSTLLPYNASFTYDLSSEMSDVCLANAAANASGEIDIKFCSFCVQNPTGGSPLTSNVGISTLKEQFENWPQDVPNGYLVLESGKKGLVLTRTTPAAIGEANWVKGMIIFDTTPANNCISIYNGTTWKCIERACNE